MVQTVLRPAILEQRHRKALIWISFVCLFLVVCVTLLSYRSALFASEAAARNRLTLQVQGLVTALDKFRLLTPLLARRPDILSIFSSDRDDEDVEAALEGMVRISGMSDAVDVTLTFLDGKQMSIREGGFSPMGPGSVQRLSRRDIVQALDGRLGRLLLNGPQGRFYIFSFGARIDGAIAGVVSVHVDLSGTEQIWALSPQPIIATEKDRVLLSNRQNWLNARIDADDLNGHAWGLSSGSSLFGPLLFEAVSQDVTKLVDANYVAAEQRDHVLGWTFYAFEPQRRPILIAALAFVVSSLLAGFLVGALWVFFNQQEMVLSRRRKDMAASLRLERLVRDRTRELRQTQAGLIHSAKLAAIGQMSTVLSHEYNQPLAAIRTYAENAQLLFSSGREEQGQDNLSRIGKLVDRLANLSKSLKSFARKPGVDVRAVSVEMVVDEAVMLMLPQAKKSGVELVVVRTDQDFKVLAGHTRLEQVLINLIANALDAIVEARSEGDGTNLSAEPSLVHIVLSKRDETGVVEVSDNGPGIDPALRREIFEPFVTSKGHGVGLGLGLPIAFNLVKGFGGTLRCHEPTIEGMTTAFEISLPLVSDDADGAVSQSDR